MKMKLNLSHFLIFEKNTMLVQQDLPTKGANGVEHFIINGTLLLVFANYYGDTPQAQDKFNHLHFLAVASLWSAT